MTREKWREHSNRGDVKITGNKCELHNCIIFKLCSRAFPKNTRVIFTSRVFREGGGGGTDNETADNKKFGFCQFLM